MTAVPKDPAISELRDLFKYLQEFRVVFHETGVEEVKTPFGNSWSIWDLEYLYSQCDRLTLRQRQAITLCLVHGMREKDAAVAMGVSPTNPVMMYATLGLRRLLDMIEDGELERFHHDRMSTQDRQNVRTNALHHLADIIKAQVRIIRHDCWILPGNPGGSAPLIRVRSLRNPSGIVLVHPMQIMYEAHVGPIPQFFRLEHPGRSVEACVNPSHPKLVMTDEGRRRQRALLAAYNRQQEGRAS